MPPPDHRLGVGDATVCTKGLLEMRERQQWAAIFDAFFYPSCFSSLYLSYTSCDYSKCYWVIMERGGIKQEINTNGTFWKLYHIWIFLVHWFQMSFSETSHSESPLSATAQSFSFFCSPCLLYLSLSPRVCILVEMFPFLFLDFLRILSHVLPSLRWPSLTNQAHRTPRVRH